MEAATDIAGQWEANANAPFGSPFSEAPAVRADDRYISPTIMLALSPFADHEDGGIEGQTETVMRDAFAQLRDDSFHEAVSALAEELEAAVDERFEGEDPANVAERERFARSYLAPTQFEADQYLASLETSLAEVDAGAMSSEALDGLLERLDPTLSDLSPAGEEFIGGLIKKAKGVVRKVASVAKQAAKLASPLLMPILGKLRALVRPLLERVLRFAVGKLPAPLRPVARTVADRILGKSSTPAAPAAAAGAAMAPAQATDTEELADTFDLCLAEALSFPETLEQQQDEFGIGEAPSTPASDELGDLTEARRALIEGLASSDGPEALGPEIEQFVPILLAALRTGISIVGRPKVVSFLSGYLAKMIAQWAGPQSKPLSKAIVDAGLKMVSLEAEGADNTADSTTARAGPVAMASVVEDTVRRLAEADEFVFEDPDLTEVAIAEAFGEAAATFLPQETLREELQLAPMLGGRFVTHRSGLPRSYAKYNRVPEVTISARAADTLPGFGGGTLGASMRAAGGRFPLRARMHIFHTKPGASAATMVRHGLGHGLRNVGIFPLTRRAAGSLLREPGLGAATPARFMHSHRRLGAGQRLYVLEPLDQTVAGAGGAATAPGKAWVSINPAKSRVTLGFYLSEADAQLVAGAVRTGRGPGEVLRRVMTSYRRLADPTHVDTGGLAHEDGEDLASFAARSAAKLPGGFFPMLRNRIAAWALPALSAWLRDHAEKFQAAAAHPDPGVRILIRLFEVPGLAQALAAGEGKTLAALQAAMKGKPKISIAVHPGGKKR